jgi:hypothetical protein
MRPIASGNSAKLGNLRGDRRCSKLRAGRGRPQVGCAVGCDHRACTVRLEGPTPCQCAIPHWPFSSRRSPANSRGMPKGRSGSPRRICRWGGVRGGFVVVYLPAICKYDTRHRTNVTRGATSIIVFAIWLPSLVTRSGGEHGRPEDLIYSPPPARVVVSLSTRSQPGNPSYTPSANNL